MNLSDGITQAYKNKWSFNNTFTVEFHFNAANTIFQDYFGEYNTEKINLNIINIQTPEFSNTPIEAWVGDRWRIHNTRDNVYRFSITFRDMDQMSLYKAWTSAYFETKWLYFDDISFTVILFKDADWHNENKTPFLLLHNTLIDSVSQLTFNNETQNQIAEFTVNFKCVAPLIF